MKTNDKNMAVIRHVVTYVSADGSFGGPLSVAIAQTRELACQGNTVELLAGWDGSQKLSIPGVTVRLFRTWRLGPSFTGLISPGLWWYIIKSRSHTKIAHIHMGRDLISLISAYIAMLLKVPFVVQTHGMVQVRRSYIVRMLDFVTTRRIFRKSKSIIALTEAEIAEVTAVAKSDVRIKLIVNGVSHTDTSDVVRNQKRILFLARLHPRKRVLEFAAMCKILREQNLDFEAIVVGPDEGDLSALRAYIKANDLDAVLSYRGSIEPGTAVKTLAASGIFVLPSFGEIFPMTVLESLVAGTPVVTTRDSGMAPVLSALGAADITDGTAANLAASVTRLLTDEEYRIAMVRCGTTAITNEFNIQSVVRCLEEIYALDDQ